jgi:UDP:flavonoid glycosyltransferase YjiC (YdhE family)
LASHPIPSLEAAMPNVLMPHVLIASVPTHGHVAPLRAVAAGLVERGYQVRFLTGARFEDSVRATGATFVPLPADADYDDRLLGAQQADAPRLTGVKRIRRDVSEVFLAPARSQYEAIMRQAAEPTDAVLADPAFVGAFLYAGHPAAERAALIGCGVLPLGLTSRHVAPFGLGIAPMRGPAGVARNALLRVLTEQVIFGAVQREFEAIHRDIHGHDSGVFALNWFSATDAIVQFSVESFEYPRPDATVEIRFAGPAARTVASTTELPDWWPDLGGPRPIVHVTQGTIANTDFTELVRPTLDALAREDVLVVVATGGRPVSELGTLPGNARAAEFLPYDRLFPLTAVMVTNGGFGGVHYALEHAVPIVIAGDTEDKPEVAARVAWSGVGINLKTGHPKPEAIRSAVTKVLGDPRYREAAARAAEQIRASEGVDALAATIEQVIATR